MRPEQTAGSPSPKSWTLTAVRCWAGARADERPLSFLHDDGELKVRLVLKSWLEPDYRCFRVETEDGRVFDLRNDEHEDSWEVRETKELPV